MIVLRGPTFLFAGNGDLAFLGLSQYLLRLKPCICKTPFADTGLLPCRPAFIAMKKAPAFASASTDAVNHRNVLYMRRSQVPRLLPGTQVGSRHQSSSTRSRLDSPSMTSVLPSRHSSYTQFSASTRNACRRMTRCRVSSASGTKAGTTSKTFFKLRALSFCFCPKVRGGSPLEARWRRKRPF